MSNSEADSSRTLLERVEQAHRAVSDEGRPEAMAKRERSGQLSARQRIDGLLDAGSFREAGALVEPLRDNDFNRELQAPADGIITGTGRIDGRFLNVASHDYTVAGGSSGKVGSRKLERLMHHSRDNGVPLALLLEGGGHRIQDGMNAAHFSGASPVFQNIADLSGWVPVVAGMMGQGFAGPTNYAALADFVVMVRGMSTMGMAGPALVKAGTGQQVDKEQLGGAAVQADEQGIADLAVDTEAECLDALRRFLSYLPSNASHAPPCTDHDAADHRTSDALLDLLPADSRKVYDVRKIIDAIVDRGSGFELKPRYARNVVTSLARLAGKPIGVIANQPMRMGGILDTRASEKAAHFVALCDAFGLPLVFLIDVPGFAIGPAAEASGLGRRSGRLFFELGIATVPRISVVMRKGYGGGYFAMAGGRAFGVDACFAWPTAEICAMSIEGAVDVAFKRDYQSADDPEAARQALIERIRAQTGALEAAHDFGIDAVIDPRATRSHLIEVFAAAAPRRASRSPRRYRPISPV